MENSFNVEKSQPKSKSRILMWTGIIAVPVIIILLVAPNFMTSDREDLRAESRDNLRITNVKMIRLAAEMYYDFNGQYPATLEDMVKGGHISMLPIDPKTNMPYEYTMLDEGKNYEICVDLETQEDKCFSATGGDF